MNQSRSETTRQKILQAALDCFSRHGYDATGVAEICQAANISKGAFYHHFPSKQAIFIDLLESWLATLDLAFNQALNSGKPVPETLTEMAQVAPSVYQVAGGWLPMFLEFWAQSMRDPLIGAKVIAPYRRYQRMFADLLERGVAEGSLETIDTNMAARGLVGLAVGMLLQGLLDPQSADWGNELQQSIYIYLEGIRRRKT
jgi:AcrR family transcriptional regulator